MTSDKDNPSLLLCHMFDAAVAAAQPALCLPAHLPEPPKGRVIVIGAGKAAAAMAQTVEREFKGELSGLVITRYGHAVPCTKIEVVEAAHPVSDGAGLAATERMLGMVEDLSPDDLVICLVSGGGSALLVAPLDGVTLTEKQQLTKALLSSGATISEMNCVRRHLSRVKGGRLAVACYPARLLTLVISDVPGDDPVDIASGPTVGDPTTRADALAILARYAIAVPPSVATALESAGAESVKPDDPRLLHSELRLIASPRMALEVAAAQAQKAGITCHILSDALEGEARDMGRILGGIALHTQQHSQPFVPPCILLSGGESTVTVKGDGRGGRNVEFLLALALTLKGANNIYALAADTDGVDGREEIAGAVITPSTLARARAAGLNLLQELDRNNAHEVFEILGDSLITGPTLTNVNDFRAIQIG